jgi:hypothetical protein
MLTEKSDKLLRLLRPQRLLFSVLVRHDDRGKVRKLQNAEANAVLLILLLQGGGKFVIALIRDDREDVHAPIVLAFALLIDAEP